MPIKALAVLDLALTVVPGADATKLLEVGGKGAAKAGGEQAAFALVRWIAGKTDGKVAADLSDIVLRDAFRARKEGGTSALRDAERAAGCALCFPAGTLVTTAHGAQAIQTLHVGDVVQAEDPATGKVEAEAVQAVIEDPVSPLIAVDLSDGSAITVTADHPFWLDNGTQVVGPGWFAAGSLQAGDELRTASGAHVMVVGLRHNVGHAVVYTLTVGRDHTFFVGEARVLVHNANCFDIIRYSEDATGFEKHHGVLDVWAQARNILGYTRSGAPTVVLTKEQHAETNRVFRDWLEARTGKRVGGRVDWTQVSAQEAVDLAKRMFAAAHVPASVSQQYFEYFRRLYPNVLP